MKVLRRDRVVADVSQKLSIRCALTDVFVRNVPISAVFFYGYKLDTGALTRGLSRVLGDYAPFNGRLRRRGLEHFIDCGENGASFSVVECDRSLAATVASLDATKTRLELIDEVNARGAWSAAHPVLALRVTNFAGGGSALGVSAHHTISDWKNVMQLLRAWSNAVAGRDYEKPLLVEDRDEYLNRTLPATDDVPPNLRYLGLPELGKLGAYMITKGRDKQRITIHFEQDELSRMRASLQDECGQRLSTNDAVSAHVCSVISARDVQRRDRRLSVAIEFRKRAGLPDNLVGNMVTAVDATCEWGKPASRIAADLRSGVDQFRGRFLNHRANLQLVQRHGGVAKITRFVPNAIDPFAGSILVSNASGLGYYDIDFGAAAPSHYITAGNAPLPWLGIMHEGFGNRGLIVDLELPAGVVARMRDETGLRELHKYRDSAPRREASSNPAWLT